MITEIKLYYKITCRSSNRCSRDITSSDKEKEKTGGLVYAIALTPLDPAHLVHNGCDKGLERFPISTRQQGPEDVGEVEAWVAEATFTSTF